MFPIDQKQRDDPLADLKRPSAALRNIADAGHGDEV